MGPASLGAKFGGGELWAVREFIRQRTFGQRRRKPVRALLVRPAPKSKQTERSRPGPSLEFPPHAANEDEHINK